MAELHIIAAVASNGIIGSRNGLPWTLPTDLAYFARVTRDHVCVVGQTTFRTLPPLPHRTVIVVSRRGNRVVDYNYAGRSRVHRLRDNTLEQALQRAQTLAHNDARYWVIGGARIYAQTLPLATQLHITHVHAAPPGDTRFPRFDMRDWAIHDVVQDAAHAWTRCVYHKEELQHAHVAVRSQCAG